MSEITKIKIIQEHIDKMNKQVRNSPYSFTWSFPTNHTKDQKLSYFCIHCHCSLVQETEDRIERNNPITLLYSFGRLQNIDRITKIESISKLNDWFHITLGNTIAKYMLSLTRLVNGDNSNINFQKIDQ